MAHILVRNVLPGKSLQQDTPVPASGDTLAQAVYLSGLFPPPALCSALGRCGRCRVRFLSAIPDPDNGEKDVLSHHALEQGWRLACRHKPLPGMHVELPRLDHASAVVARNAAAACAGLAVDLGTTSLHWQGVGSAGDVVRQGVEVNPQMGAGSDIISRLAYAAQPGGRARLRKLVLAALTRIVESFGGKTQECCLAANPAMTCIVLDKDTAGLASAPYSLEYAGGRLEQVPDLPPVWIPPLLSPFVGGDIAAGYAALTLGRNRADYPFLLADLGTNGEFILALSPETALAASIPLGPALEGINLHCGTDARHGAITAFHVTKDGLVPEVMGACGAVGICGAGYVSLLQCLLAVGILQPDGALILSGHGKRAHPLAAKMGNVASGQADGMPGQAKLRLPGRMFLTAADVEELLKVKAAFSLVVSRLLQVASLPPARLKTVYVAGALGEHIPRGAMEALGFLPPGLGERTSAVGNASLAGAALLLRCPETKDALCAWAPKVATLDLTVESNFLSSYVNHMTFNWNT